MGLLLSPASEKLVWCLLLLQLVGSGTSGTVNGSAVCRPSVPSHRPCPAGWTEWGKQCYNIGRRNSWSHSRGYCHKLGSRLAVPRSRQEGDFLAGMLPQDSNFWVDCSDLQVKGQWACSGHSPDASLDFILWAPSQPDYSTLNGGTEERCAMVGETGEWHNAPCDHSNYPISSRPQTLLII